MASLSTTICALVLVSAVSVSVSAISLQEICTQTRTPRFCYALLNGHALDNLRQLNEAVIVATTDSASKTSAKIQSLLSQTTDPNLKVVYSLCSNYYSAALAALSAAKEKIRSGDFGSVRSAADTAADEPYRHSRGERGVYELLLCFCRSFSDALVLDYVFLFNTTKMAIFQNKVFVKLKM